MFPPTVEEARETWRRARAAFVAAGGKLSEEPSAGTDGLSCADLHMVSSIALWHAVEALVHSYGDEYVSYYLGLSDAYAAAAAGCDAADAGP